MDGRRAGICAPRVTSLPITRPDARPFCTDHAAYGSNGWSPLVNSGISPETIPPKSAVMPLSIYKWLIIAIAPLMICRASSAEEFAVMGLGANSCGRFVELYRLDPTRTEDGYINWAQGFLSGMNMAALLNSGMSKNLKMPVENYGRALRRYCDQHPLGEVMEGMLEFYRSLPENKPVK